MPRKPMDASRVSALMQELSVGALLRIIPHSLVEEALIATGTQSKRNRLLPAPAVVFLVIMLGLNAEVSVKENLRLLLTSLRRRLGLDRVKIAGGTAISFARRRLGVAPLAWLFDRVARPLSGPGKAGGLWRGLRPVAVDGTSLELQCTEANSRRFGRPGNQHGEAGYPQVQVVALLECATRAPFGIAYSHCHEDEPSLAARNLYTKLQSDMILLADRAYFSFSRWRDAAAVCGALLWRMKNNATLRPIRRLGDGSYLTRIQPSHKLIAKGAAQKGESMIVRVVEYDPVMEDGRRGERVRLITTMVDPDEVSAQELAELFPSRWDVETGFDELKTHLKGSGRVLRSQLPELAVQEMYGFFLAYYVTRATMAEAADRAGCAPAQLSFTHAVRVIKRHTAFFPSAK